MFATAGLPDPDPPEPPAGPLVAIAVGKTNEGESLPANPGNNQPNLETLILRLSHIPSLEKPVPLEIGQPGESYDLDQRLVLTCP